MLFFVDFRNLKHYTRLKINQELAIKYGKDGLARSADLVSRQKNRIFDLDRLREVESKKFLSKS